MDENPYNSPEYEPEIEKRLRKPPNRYFGAGVCGYFGFAGVFLLQMVLMGLLRPPFPVSLPLYTVPLLFFIPSAVGIAMARWAWRYPESKWSFPVAIILGLLPIAIILIGVFFFGLR